MLELQELCPSLDPKKIVSTALGPHAFISVGDVIYYKNDSLEEWVRPGFTVNRIEINKSASLVALSGDSIVAVYSFEGKLKFQDTMPSAVLKLLWHPLGVDDSCLVVMSLGLIRSIWLDPVGYPVVNTLDFTRNAVGAQDGPQFANSMTFGPSTIATGGFTLYLSTDEGSIFAINPFLPPKFQLTSTQYNDLLDYAASAYSQHQGGEDSGIYTQQLEWVKSIEEQITEPQELKNGSGYVHILSSIDPAPLYCQGPLKVCPYPEELYESDFRDLASFSFGNLHLLVQASSRFLLLLLLDEPTPAHWAFTQGSRDSTLTLLEMLEVSEQPHNLRITENLIWGETSTGTTLFTPYLVKTLEESLGTGSVGTLPATKITQLPKSVIYANIVDATACSVLDFCQTNDYHYVISSTFSAPEFQAETQALASVKPRSYHNELIGDLQNALKDLKLEPSGSVPGLPEDNVKSLAKLDKIADAYTQEMAKLYKCVDMAFDVMDLQKMELNHQLSSTTKLTKTIDDFETLTLSKRVEEVLERQSRIQKRFKVFEDRVRSHHASISQPIGQMERRWFRELNGQSSTVDQFEQRRGAIDKDFEGVSNNPRVDSSHVTPTPLSGLASVLTSPAASNNYRIPLHHLQRLNHDIETMKTKLRSAPT